MSSPEATENLISTVDIDNLAVSNMLLEEVQRPEETDDGGIWNGFKNLMGTGLGEIKDLAVAIGRGVGSTPRSLASFGQYASDKTEIQLPLVSRVDGLFAREKHETSLSTRVDFASVINPETYNSPYVASNYQPMG